jgi:ATP adenylyltransferase
LATGQWRLNRHSPSPIVFSLIVNRQSSIVDPSIANRQSVNRHSKSPIVNRQSEMEHLWSPWRLAYITGAAQAVDCVFCNALTDPVADPLVVHRGPTCFVILNLFPYNNGHLMVIPNRHIASLAAATADELRELMELTRACEIALVEAYAPHGLNMGINLGRPAGAGVLDHVHMHVVPRWNGDTNFMTVTARTRVLAEELADTAAKLRPIFQRLADG